MTTEQIKKLVAHIDKVREVGSKTNDSDRSTRVWIDARTKDEASVRAARARLVAVGIPDERIQRFSPDQVILLDEKREYEVRRDEIMKFMNLPAWQTEAWIGSSKPAKEPALFEIFVPALNKVRRAQGRLEQRIALLRHVEALRMYAAEHAGQLPEALSALAVPLPDDPFTGKPFAFKVEGATAHFRGSPPPGEEANPSYNVRYELTLHEPIKR